MRRLLPALILAASCGGPRRIEQPAVVTLLGPEARLETWAAQAAEGVHLHPGGGLTCLMIPLMTPALPDREDPKARARADMFASVMEDFAVIAHGPSYGGPGRLTLALRRLDPGSPACDEALVVTVPSLEEGREERAFGTPDILAGYHRPSTATEAVLERGRVNVRRLGPGRWEFSIFLVLKPVDPGRPYDRLQAVTRVEAAARR